jgi:hypothetical protein
MLCSIASVRAFVGLPAQIIERRNGLSNNASYSGVPSAWEPPFDAIFQTGNENDVEVAPVDVAESLPT